MQVAPAPIAARPSPPASISRGALSSAWGDRLLGHVRHPRAMALAGIVAAVALVPLGFIIAVLLSVGWADAAAMIFRPRVGELLVNTAVLEALAVPAAIGLGVGLAWLTERTD